MYLFTVEDHFMITGRGLTLVPGIDDKPASIGDKINIVRPDNTVITSSIKSMSIFSLTKPICVDSSLTKEDIPIGSEIWLVLK